MSSMQRRKGFAYEREIVEVLKEAGFKAERCWGSNGRTRGLPEEVDIVCNTGSDSDLWFQCKRKKAISKYLIPTEGIYATIIREDRGENLAVIRLSDLLTLMEKLR